MDKLVSAYLARITKDTQQAQKIMEVSQSVVPG
jgi:hypothetical protein